MRVRLNWSVVKFCANQAVGIKHEAQLSWPMPMRGQALWCARQKSASRRRCEVFWKLFTCKYYSTPITTRHTMNTKHVWYICEFVCNLSCIHTHTPTKKNKKLHFSSAKFKKCLFIKIYTECIQKPIRNWMNRCFVITTTTSTTWTCVDYGVN